MLWMWGVAGAFVYATNALILGLWNDGATPRGRIKSSVEYVAALATGGIFAEGLTGVIVGVLATGVNVNGYQLKMEGDPIAVALCIGWSANYLWPRILRKIGARVEALNSEGQKA